MELDCDPEVLDPEIDEVVLDRVVAATLDGVCSDFFADDVLGVVALVEVVVPVVVGLTR